ncbi:MAG: DUF481 domain-containing protein [Putridiphycobacter sp.]|nr:DUF481 domain-containing protein [Putridiphycobacter sp.]
MRFLLILYLSLVSCYTTAQIVNIENKRLVDNKEGFSGSAELNLNFTMNTVQLLQIGDKIRVGYLKKRHQFLMVTDHAFVKSGVEDFLNRGFEHFRYNYVLKDSGAITFEAFQQAQFNRIQKIDLRFIIGSGLRFRIIDKNNYQLNIGTGIMGEYERLLDVGLSSDVLSTNYLSFDAQFSENVGLNTISYFQPKFIDFGNYRFSNETSIRFKINENLTFLLIYTLTHDNRDIPDVRKTNYILKNTLRIWF